MAEYIHLQDCVIEQVKILGMPVYKYTAWVPAALNDPKFRTFTRINEKWYGMLGTENCVTNLPPMSEDRILFVTAYYNKAWAKAYERIVTAYPHLKTARIHMDGATIHEYI